MIDPKMTHVLDVEDKNIKAPIIALLSYVQGDLLGMKSSEILAQK